MGDSKIAAGLFADVGDRLINGVAERKKLLQTH